MLTTYLEIVENLERSMDDNKVWVSGNLFSKVSEVHGNAGSCLYRGS